MKENTSKANPHSLVVHTYSVRIYPGRSSNATADVSGKALGYIILRGEGTPFTIQFFPDGSSIPRPVFNTHDGTVDLCMNWCQLEELLIVLKQADSVQGNYFEDAEGPWADVEGQFVRKK
jgi:hypothetical protein